MDGPAAHKYQRQNQQSIEMNRRSYVTVEQLVNCPK